MMMGYLLVLACVGWGSAIPTISIFGLPRSLGGPETDLFDQPFVSFTTYGNTTVIGVSSNQLTFIGANSTAMLPTPAFTGLGRGPNVTDLDHCGSWLNAVVPESNSSVVHGFYHEEWKCNYSDNFFTNKSIAYALSTDGGHTFTKPNHPNNAIIVPAVGNTTSLHQTGEGDHGAVRFGEWLMLWFREWDGYHGQVTVGLARASTVSGGRPGAWQKWLLPSTNNLSRPLAQSQAIPHASGPPVLESSADGWGTDSPGLGGESSMIAGIPGTAVYTRPADSGRLMAIGELEPPTGAFFDGQTRLGFSDDGISWPASLSPPEPISLVQRSTWARSDTAPELRGYSSLSGRWGAATDGLSDEVRTVWTYWPAGSDQRFLVSHPLTLMHPAATGSADPPSSLIVVGEAACNGSVSGATSYRTTTAPVGLRGTPTDGCEWSNTSLALVMAYRGQRAWQSLRLLVECPGDASGSSTVLAATSAYDPQAWVNATCPGGSGVKPLRPIGYVWANATAVPVDAVSVTGTVQLPSRGSEPYSITMHASLLVQTTNQRTAALPLSQATPPDAVALGVGYALDTASLELMASRDALVG
jgi:hypothetical protein